MIINKNFFRSFTIMSIITTFSRVLGYVRDLLFAFVMGAGPLADAFLLAFRIPNLFRRFFAEGAINNAFVPLYLEIKKKNGDKKAELFVGQFFILLLIVLVVIVVIIELFMTQVISFLAPGFSFQLIEKSSFLASVMMPYLIFISISSLIGATLNAHGRYALWAFSPIILNLLMITGMSYSLLFSLITEEILSWSVLISGLLQFSVLLAWVKIKKIKVTFVFPTISGKIKKLIFLLFPNLLAGAVVQINQFVGIFFASSIAGAISWLYYSDRIVQLPLGIFAISISTILLTSLSKSKDNKKDYAEKINSSFILMVAITFLCMAVLIAIPDLIVDILFKRGNFGYGDAKATSDALVMYALGLPAFAIIKLFSTIFFAKKDTRSPFYISFISMIVNVLIIYSLIDELGHLGIALALSIASWFNVFFLYLGLKFKKYWKIDRSVFLKIFKLILISFLTFITLYICYFSFIFYDLIMLSNIYKKVLFLVYLSVIAGLTFIILSFFFKLLKIKDITGNLFRKSFYGE